MMMKKIQHLIRKIWRPVLTLLAFYPLVHILVTDWEDIQEVLSNIRWDLLVISLLLLFLILPMMAAISWISLRYLEAHVPSKKVFSIYFISQLGKYLPGGIWAFPGRMLAYQSVGVEQSRSIASVFREVSALLLTSITVSLLIIFQEVSLSSIMKWALIAGAIISIVVILVTQTFWFWRLLASLKIRKTATLPLPFTESDRPLVSFKWIPAAVSAGLVFWLAMGFPFQYLSRAISPQSSSLSWIGAAAIFALAWTVGFIVFITPAGLGVREAVLSLLLSTFMPVSAAVSIALISRLAWMLVEAIWILISIWLSRDWQRIQPANI
jgi:uncharacterized membrane protein YbhN (UPF0104 family)